MVEQECKSARFPFSIACTRMVELIEAIDALPAEAGDASELKGLLRAQEESAREAGCVAVAQLARAAGEYAANVQYAALPWKALVIGRLLNHIPTECLFGRSPDRAAERNAPGECASRRKNHA